MSSYDRKFISAKTLDLDPQTRRVKIAIASTENIDRDKDAFNPVAFEKTIKERGPAGTNEIWHLLDHDKTSFSALSKFAELGKQGPYIYGVSQYKDSFAWREVAWPLYEAGDFTQHSVGFTTIKSLQRDNYREIMEVALWEGSAVLWGANASTPTMNVYKSMSFEEIQQDGLSRIERIIKALKVGKYEDESHKSLLIIELKQLQNSIENIAQKATLQPSENDTIKPDLSELFSVLNNINNTFQKL